MAVFVWAAAVAGSWSVGANWQVGGVAQAAPPTAADDVQLGFGTGATNSNLTIDTAAVCRSLIASGYTGTVTGQNAQSLSVGDASGGTFTLIAGMGWNGGAGSFSVTFAATSTNGGVGWPITTAGKSIIGGGVASCSFTGNGGRWQLQDNMTLAAIMSSSNTNAIDFNSKNVSCTRFNPGNTTDCLNMATFTCSTVGNGVTAFNFPSTGAISGTPICIITGVTANSRSIALNDKTLNTFTETVAGSTGSIIVDPGSGGTGTITNINFSDASNARSFVIVFSKTLHFTNWVGNGTAGKLITITTNSAGVRATLTKDGNGLFSADFLNVKDIDAEGIINFFAGANSTDGGNNLHWTFTIPPVVMFNTLRPFNNRRAPYIHRSRLRRTTHVPGQASPGSGGVNAHHPTRQLRGWPKPRGRTFKPVPPQLQPIPPGVTSTSHVQRGRPAPRGRTWKPIPPQLPAADIGIVEPTWGLLDSSGRTKGVLTS